MAVFQENKHDKITTHTVLSATTRHYDRLTPLAWADYCLWLLNQNTAGVQDVKAVDRSVVLGLVMFHAWTGFNQSRKKNVPTLIEFVTGNPRNIFRPHLSEMHWLDSQRH